MTKHIVRMVIVDRKGTVHDLGGGKCPAMINLRREFSRGTERYAPVKGLQVRVFKLPGCTDCFGSMQAFEEYIKTT
jgi:hypothetical protein